MTKNGLLRKINSRVSEVRGRGNLEESIYWVGYEQALFWVAEILRQPRPNRPAPTEDTILKLASEALDSVRRELNRIDGYLQESIEEAFDDEI
jgi:hypothetical protein